MNGGRPTGFTFDAVAAYSWFIGTEVSAALYGVICRAERAASGREAVAAAQA